MAKLFKSIALCASMISLAALSAAQADAQRRPGGGGGRAAAGSRSMSSGSFSSSRQVRSSASANVNRTSGSRSGQLASNSAATRPSTGAVNTGNRVNTGNVNAGNNTNINSGNRTNINTGNINTGDVNINRGDVNIDVDGGYGCCGYGDWDYHPVAAGVAVGTAVAVTNAWRLGAYYSTLPASCVVVYRGTVTYYQCGTYWYQPVYSGMTVQYVAVVKP